MSSYVASMPPAPPRTSIAGSSPDSAPIRHLPRRVTALDQGQREEPEVAGVAAPQHAGRAPAGTQLVPAVVEEQPGRDRGRVGAVAAGGEQPQPAATGAAERVEQGQRLLGVGRADRARLAHPDLAEVGGGHRRQQVGAVVAVGLLGTGEQLARQRDVVGQRQRRRLGHPRLDGDRPRHLGDPQPRVEPRELEVQRAAGRQLGDQAGPDAEPRPQPHLARPAYGGDVEHHRQRPAREGLERRPRRPRRARRRRRAAPGRRARRGRRRGRRRRPDAAPAPPSSRGLVAPACRPVGRSSGPPRPDDRPS